jgi:hypothetical protein
MLSLFVTCGFAQTYTNGVFVKNGVTTEIKRQVYQFTPTNAPEIFYFSNELIAKVNTNSDFTVNTLFQEVLNTNAIPEKAKFGGHNFAATLMNGTMMLSYSGGDSNTSSCTMSTPMVDVELSKGLFYFEVTDKKVIIAILEGSMKYYNGKKENPLTVGQAVIAEPSDVGILENKVSISPGKVNSDAMKKLLANSKEITNLKGTILFARIDGKLVGIVIN